MSGDEFGLGLELELELEEGSDAPKEVMVPENSTPSVAGACAGTG